MLDLVGHTWSWIKDDFSGHPWRFVVELVAWIISIACSVVMAFTVPDPPLIYLYPSWIMGCAMYSWAAWTRNSFGMLANYLLLVTIDSVGLVRLLLQ